MEREPENVIDGTARAHQWRRSPSTTVDDGPDGAEARSDAPKSIAGSLLVPVELLTEAAPLEQAPRHAGSAADPGGAAGASGNGRSAGAAHENPFLLPEAAVLDHSSAERPRIRVARRLQAGVAAIRSPRRWLRAPAWRTSTSAPIRPRRLASPSSSPRARLAVLARPGSAGRGRRGRRAGMTGLLVTVLVAAGCVVLAGVATQGGHPRVARPSLSRGRQLAAVGAGNDPVRGPACGHRRAGRCREDGQIELPHATASAKAKAKTRRLARARVARQTHCTASAPPPLRRPRRWR